MYTRQNHTGESASGYLECWFTAGCKPFLPVYMRQDSWGKFSAELTMGDIPDAIIGLGFNIYNNILLCLFDDAVSGIKSISCFVHLTLFILS